METVWKVGRENKWEERHMQHKRGHAEGKKEVNESKDSTGGTRRNEKNEKGSQEGQTLKEGLRERQVGQMDTMGKGT